MKISPERILFEDNHLLVINKLPSEIAQADKTGDISLIDDVKAYLKERYQKPGNVFAGLVHRIDRPVSGAILFAKTGKALTRMTNLIKTRDIRKIYLAVVKNKPFPDEGLLEHYLLKNEKQNKSYIVGSTVSGARLSRLQYRLLGSSLNYHLVQIELLTGRHHQIRAQMAAIGSPIKGDLKYGSPRSNPDGSIHLHAWKLIFEHPVSKELMTIVAPLPDQAWDYFKDILPVTD